MNIDSIIKSIDLSSVVSEEDVRTKVAIPILECLGFPIANRAEDFPVYAYEGRKPLRPKAVDIILFSHPDFASHRARDNRDWVMNHSLVVVELKRPEETLFDAQGQATFYSMWTRALYYICTNGKKIGIFRLQHYTADLELCNCKITELPNCWLNIIESISFDKLIAQKNPEVPDKNLLRYQDYCFSELSAFQSSSEWYWEQTINIDSKEQERKKLSPYELINNQQHVILLARPGAGKTTCFRFLFKICVQEYLGGTSQLPILLSAKFWKRNFSTLEEGIYKELSPFLTYLTPEVVKLECNQGKYLVFIDGLDECLNDRDLLIEEINNLSGVKCIVSCRKERYYNELVDFQKYELELLSDEEIVLISTRILGYETSTTIHSMDLGLKNLIKTPLYFHMWLSYCMINPNSKIPVNMSILLNEFLGYLLKDYIIKKGNYNVENIPTESIKSVLAEFAYCSFDTCKQVDLSTIINKNCSTTATPTSEISIIIFQSGLIYDFNGIIDFQHFSMKEYFFALYISRLTISEVIAFLETYHKDEKYEEVIFLLLGLMQEEQEQNLALDYLECNNLRLFIKGLNKRYNFSNKYIDNITRETCHAFFAQVLSSYENIINKHFYVFKVSFFPWVKAAKEIKLNNAKIKGCINPDNLSVSIELLLLSNNELEKVEVDFLETKPIVSAVRNGEKYLIPVLSLSDNQGHFYFNISELYSGVDCAREIAIEIIKKNIDQILDNDLLLLNEPPYMQLCYIEETLQAISPIEIIYDNEIKKFNLSFKNQSITELEKIFNGIKNYSYSVDRYFTKLKSFFVVWFLLQNNINAEVDPKQVCFPDIDYKSGISGWVWDLYSMETIVIWLQSHYDERQKSYRIFVERFFPTLMSDFGMYQVGPFQYNLLVSRPSKKQKGILREGSIHITWEPKPSTYECKTIIQVVYRDKDMERIVFEQHLKDLNKKLKFLNRKNTGFFIQESAALFSVFEQKNSVRASVYKQIKDDLKKIFE